MIDKAVVEGLLSACFNAPPFLLPKRTKTPHIAPPSFPVTVLWHDLSAFDGFMRGMTHHAVLKHAKISHGHIPMKEDGIGFCLILKTGGAPFWTIISIGLGLAFLWLE